MKNGLSGVKKTLLNLSLVGVSLLVAALIGEVLVRIFWAAPGFKYPQTLHEKHPVLGWVMKPNQHAYTYNIPVTTNSHGLRDDEFTEAKPDKTVRILVLGDSVTFGVLVGNDETYSNVLERMLNAEADSVRYEVINTGVQRYYTFQELDYLREYGVKFQPDLVVVGYYINDLGFKPETWTRDYEKTREKHASYLWTKVPWLMYIYKNSALSNLVRDRIIRMIRSTKQKKNTQTRLLTGELDEGVLKKIEGARQDLAAMKKLGDEHGFPVLIAAFPGVNQVIKDFPNAKYPQFVREIADELGMPFVDLLPDFKEHYDGDIRSLYFRYNGHPNKTGHELAAKAIFKAIAEKKLLQRKEIAKTN